MANADFGWETRVRQRMYDELLPRKDRRLLYSPRRARQEHEKEDGRGDDRYGDRSTQTTPEETPSCDDDPPRFAYRKLRINPKVQWAKMASGLERIRQVKWLLILLLGLLLSSSCVWYSWSGKQKAAIGELKEPRSKTRVDEPRCSKMCVAKDCNTISIRYGKFCGVGYTGCFDEKPCDDLDACCKLHDACVDEKGVLNIACHETFKKCMVKVQSVDKPGFSKMCPYSVVIPAMTQGMDMAILFSQLSGTGKDL